MEKGADLAVRVFQFITVPSGKEEAARKACNEANAKYRFFRFVYYDNGNVAMEADMPSETQNVGDVAVELLLRLLDVADNAYPFFEQALA